MQIDDINQLLSPNDQKLVQQGMKEFMDRLNAKQ